MIETITDWKTSFPNIPLSLAIGFFDGVHLGHQKLLKEARNSDYLPAVLTFQSDFKANLRGQSPELILTEEDKERKLQEYGIPLLYLLPFTKDIRNASKEEFLDFLTRLHAKRIVVGADFTFGRNGEGKANDLKKLNNAEIVIQELIIRDGVKISSSAIKNDLRKGKIDAANALLGYPYFVRGIVVHGLENGRKLGFPTANLLPDPSLVELADGVYQTVTEVNGKNYLSMTNIGNHPTIQALDHAIIETNLLDFTGNLYGQEIVVRFFHYIRPQLKFHTLDVLKEQMAEDEKGIRKTASVPTDGC